ncbi:acyl carrier protein [Kitasatospora herbaricolor]|uniref:Acyl carrier protein n=1 Tax=Kitasatospora herbaricolor TaxID=68217 RepID=A0ABZ1W5S7_9ACTN|nr:acyl carrier protein [Kitasatospora herbaricolor]
MSVSYRIISDCLTTEFAVAPERVTPDATLEQLQLDSLALVELSLMVEERFGVTVADIRGDVTLAGLAALADRSGVLPEPAGAGPDGAR